MKKQKNENVTEKPGDNLFIALTECDSLQRNVLEVSKEFLLIHKRIEKIKVLRQEKRAMISSMVKKLRDAKSMIAKLKREVPVSAKKLDSFNKSLEMKKVKVIPSQFQSAKDQQSGVSAEPKKELSEVELLEMQLADIEARLNQM